MEAHLYVMVGPSTQENVIRRLPVEATAHQEIVDLLASQAGLFTSTGTDFIDYDPAYQPQEGEAFTVLFDLSKNLQEVVTAPDGPEDLPRKELETGRIRAIIAVEAPWAGERSCVLFQTFTLALAIRPGARIAVLLDQNTLRKVTQPGLTLGRQVDAVYTGGRLRFVNVFRVRQFLDIGPVLTPATDAQLRAFARHKNLVAPDIDGLLKAADDLTRRRIAGLLQRGLLDKIKVKKVVNAAKRFKLNVKTETIKGTSRISLPSDRSALKRLITFLDENVYNSPLTGDAFQAGGKRRWQP